MIDDIKAELGIKENASEFDLLADDAEDIYAKSMLGLDKIDLYINHDILQTEESLVQCKRTSKIPRLGENRRGSLL